MKTTTALWILPILLLGLVTLIPPVSSQEKAPTDNLANPIACRLASYGAFQEDAWEHLPSIGVEYVFMNVPKPEEIEAVRSKLTEHRLKPLVFRGETDLSKPESVDQLAEQLATCKKLGVHYLFLSPKRHGAPKETIYDRLRKVGDVAKAHGVIVSLETHPDLGTNGDVHLETMKAIDHPNIRVNFDTGNITFYNRGADACAELEKIVDYVATVELKDHDAEFETWHFPVLGKGVIDFPRVLSILSEHGYQGPITLEFEGVKGEELDRDQTLKAIEESVEYVRSQGKPRP